jgi:4-hydroxy-3-polyprenylbenzoate decarboxylase
MAYRNLQQAIVALERTGQLRRIDAEVDPHLEVGAIQRRVYRNGGPALLFTRVKGTVFPLLGNLFGTLERARFLFQDTLSAIQGLVAAKGDPATLLRQPGKALQLAPHLLHLRPQRVTGGAVLQQRTTLTSLPQLVCWPQDGGAFITLPQVYSEDPRRPGWRHSNLGMYRVQLSGGRYDPESEAGLHYQIHRGIGVHHAAAIDAGQPLPVNVMVGGPPSLALAAVMPLPEGLPELAFAGLLGGHRLPVTATPNGLLAPAEADFCLVGHVDPRRTLPEGPFGDHLGYYSLVHDFPVMTVTQVFHRPGAIWPFTTVGRPPQEDTTFGALIHEMTGALIPELVPGVRSIHAVDAAGVHPLLLAIGSERYLPYATEKEPRELLTQANALLGQGQLSLAKYLLIADGDDDRRLDLHDIAAFLCHLLERVDWSRDLHFQTRTTIDTLDYSGTGFNQGSKVVIAAAGPQRRQLPRELPPAVRLPAGFAAPRLALPGILVIQGPPWQGSRGLPAADIAAFCQEVAPSDPLRDVPLVVVADDSDFTARTLDNLLWITFTRSDPAADLHGIDAFVSAKHWGCTGPLVIDARIKTHHPSPLEDDPAVERRIEALGVPGGPLHGLV